MFINAIGHYIPHHIISNLYFQNHFGISDEDIVSKSGIRERRKTLYRENTNTMAVDAVKKMIPSLPYPVNEVDLIIGATYSPYDTVGTIAHVVQKNFHIHSAKALSISSACSSFCNAVEIADSFIRTGISGKALIIASEQNSAYNNEGDKASGFLWGDGAAAVCLSGERHSPGDLEILDVSSTGLGHIGQGPHAVYLRPREEGIRMPFGRDVFQFACKYMMEEAEAILSKHGIPVKEIRYLIPHQANLRIIDYIRKSMGLSEEQVVVNLDRLGNTGSASAAIGLSQVYRTIRPGDVVVITVFGGGYSSGAVLLHK